LVSHARSVYIVPVDGLTRAADVFPVRVPDRALDIPVRVLYGKRASTKTAFRNARRPEGLKTKRQEFTTMNIIEQLEAEQAAKLIEGKKIPEFRPGDTVIVNVKVKEGDRSRVQAYEGVVIARNGGGLNESFTVRKISYGEGVERVFPIHGPLIDSIKLVRRGKVRRAKLYYLRDRRGKSARIAERVDTKPKAASE